MRTPSSVASLSGAVSEAGVFEVEAAPLEVGEEALDAPALAIGAQGSFALARVGSDDQPLVVRKALGGDGGLMPVSGRLALKGRPARWRRNRAPCIRSDAERSLQPFESTHRALPKIDSNFQADAVARRWMKDRRQVSLRQGAFSAINPLPQSYAVSPPLLGQFS
ncbi:hypothetical protein LQ948_05815 [Jiella sp. MQZ9-1]|uniref:Uncharacterized protein n=1 Tax=Jiella flava TaxID=2816857 RepID=A0A939FZ07_9HYPH|nr:hypothetical protein [Jiella flava]MBO0661949.1 hypothetical protein [Jiella flava]MCD2470723.1 hypothetical protein [Jiella flava]